MALFGLSGKIAFSVLLSIVPLVARSLQCPDVAVQRLSNGSLEFRPLSAGPQESKPIYDPGAIEGWYSLPSGFIEVVRSGSLPYDDIKVGLKSLNVPCVIPGLQSNCTSSSLTTSTFDPFGLINNFLGWLAGMIVVTLIGGIMAASFLVCGCCFWGCRCCGNCGGGKTQKATENIDCKTFTFTGILLLFTLLLLNEQTFHSLDDFQDSINTITGTGADYINHTINEIEELLCQLAAPRNSIVTIILDEARGFSTSLKSELDKIGEEIFNVLGTLEALPAGLISTIDVLSKVRNDTLALITLFDKLQETLVSISVQLNNLLSECTEAMQDEGICNMIPPPSDVATEANYSALPDVSNELESARNALKDLNLHQSIVEGRQEFESVIQLITNSTDEIISNVTYELEQAVNSAFVIMNNVITAVRAFLDDTQIKARCPPLSDGSVFRNLETNINNLLSNTSARQVPNVGYIQQCVINQGFDYVQQYDVYRYAFGIVICSISLITIVFVLVGVAFGMIGFRRGVNAQERANLSHYGGIILLIGVSLTFVLGFLLMILTALMFFFGASAQKVCNAVEAPQYPLFAELIDDQQFWGGSLGGQLFEIVNPAAMDAVFLLG